MSNKFRLVNGDLSAYALACGYVQTSTEYPNGDTVTMRHDGCYHVHTTEAGATDDDNGPVWVPDPDHTPTPGYGAPRVRAGWATFDGLTEARRFYRSEVSRLASGHNAHALTEA